MTTGEPSFATPSSPSLDTETSTSGHTPGARFWPLSLGAVGVVYGDIGTSPLYAFREALGQTTANGVQAEAVVGVVSLALWALIVVVTIKYVLFLMRADNKGEGGVLSLMALAQTAVGKRTALVFGLGVAGAALFYGDAIITPAISVLSAVEGLRTAPGLEHSVSPTALILLSLVILVVLFAVQARGTARVARLFGPICLVWFAVIAGLGVHHLIKAPGVLIALDPLHAVRFATGHGVTGLFVLGSVFLTVTGAEALYADMGHFGRWPIQAAWLFLVLPALALNYLGQGAFALTMLRQAGGAPLQNMDWFFMMAPDSLRLPLVILATAATIIASQAVITGAFSLTSQAIQLGLLPRMAILQTSETQAGQIYLPRINLMLAVGVILLIAIFKSSSALAHAYGLAVTGTMAVTTSLAFLVVWKGWRWPLAGVLALVVPLLLVDLVFLGTNALKLLSGGFVPLLLGGACFAVMATWVRGGKLVANKIRRDSPPLSDTIAMLKLRGPHRTPGVAVYLTADADRTPGALLHNLKHNRVLHAKNVILTVRTAPSPRVAPEARARLERIDEDFSRMSLTYGFMETPDVVRDLRAARTPELPFDIMATSFFLGRRSVVASPKSPMPGWQERLFIALARNAASPTDFFHIPPGRVVEMGSQIGV